MKRQHKRALRFAVLAITAGVTLTAVGCQLLMWLSYPSYEPLEVNYETCTLPATIWSIPHWRSWRVRYPPSMASAPKK